MKTELENLIASHRLSYTLEDNESIGLSVLDRLCPDGDYNVERGNSEITFLAEEIENTFILPLESENAALKESLRELIPLAEAYEHSQGRAFPNINTIIQEAKSLL